MQNFDSYSKTYSVYIPYYNKTMTISGISYIPDFYQYKENYKTHIIENNEQYRPDRIAYNLWNNQRLTWVLNQINYFTHGIEEYVAGRSINYLDAEILQDIGIL